MKQLKADKDQNGQEENDIFLETETGEETQVTEIEPSAPITVFNDGEELMTAAIIKSEEVDLVEEGLRVKESITSRSASASRSIKRISCQSHTLQLVMGGFDKYRNSSKRLMDGSSVPLLVRPINV